MTALNMDFSEQQSKLSRILGDPDTDSDSLWPLADRKFEINQGELHFAEDSKSLLRRVEGTVASQAISLPANYFGTHILIVDDVPLTNDHEVPIADWERFKDAGDDKFYYWANTSDVEQFNFFDSSTNGLAYILFYYAKPTTVLDGDSDTSPLKSRYRNGPVFWAAKELLPMAGKTQLAAYYENEYAKLVLRAEEETEKLVKKVVKAMPDLGPAFQSDQDRLGVGSYPGPGFD